ncbi:MAG: sensor histidine kinase, partial [Bacteroidetes bacterium QS_1_63_11]
MSFLRSIWDLLLPRRASTKTWMVLTFALFVGTAVVGVGLYVLLVLRGEMRTAMQQTLRDQADRIAVQVEQEPSEARRGRIVENLTELQNLHITLVTPDTTYRPPSGPLSSDTLIDVSALQRMEEETIQFTRAANGQSAGDPLFVAALYRPSSNLIVQVAQSPPPLYDLAQRFQVVLILGMVLALILALLGSFVAT